MSLFLCFEFWIQVKRKDNAGWWEKGGNSVKLRILPDCSSRPLDYSHPVVQSSSAHCRKGKRTIVAGSMGLDRPNNVNTICLQGPLSEKTRKQGRFQPNIGLFFSSGYQERDGRRWSSSERAMSLWAGYSLHPVHEGGAGRGEGRGSKRGRLLVVARIEPWVLPRRLPLAPLFSGRTALHTSTPPRSVQRLGHHRHTIQSVLGALHCTDKRQNNERGRAVLSSGLCNHPALNTSIYRPTPPSSAEWLGQQKYKSNSPCLLKLSPIP